jgi:hypothetical protein
MPAATVSKLKHPPTLKVARRIRKKTSEPQVQHVLCAAPSKQKKGSRRKVVAKSLSLKQLPPVRRPFAQFCRGRLTKSHDCLQQLAREWKSLGIEGQLVYKESYQAELKLAPQIVFNATLGCCTFVSLKQMLQTQQT